MKLHVASIRRMVDTSNLNKRKSAPRNKERNILVFEGSGKPVVVVRQL
jgi:hypothetical protein